MGSKGGEMKKILVILLLLILLPIKLYAIECKSSGHTIMNIYFSPYGGATDAIEAEINVAKKTIRVLGYSFTSPIIIAALIEAQERGVSVEVILDKTQKSSAAIADMAKRGVKVYIDSKHAIMHNKTMIFDDNIVQTGSFNYSVSAEIRNAENILIVKKNRCLASVYFSNFLDHKKHSEQILVGGMNGGVNARIFKYKR